MYDYPMLIGARLVEHYRADPKITSLLRPTTRRRRQAARHDGGRAEAIDDVELFLRNGGFSG